MKNYIKMLLKRIVRLDSEYRQYKTYYKHYVKYSFDVNDCHSEKQYEANIIRLYHTIEKGLSYQNYRAGFGEKNIESLMKSMEKYSKNYDTDAWFYRTALSVLVEYIKKNKDYGLYDEELDKRVKRLPGKSNGQGGVVCVSVPDTEKMNYEELVKSRHSVRQFSNQEVDIDIIKSAISLAQYTPSACNRQGWKTYIIKSKNIIDTVLDNQNGNKGFGDKINKLLIITGDLQAFNYGREVFQVFIDGGMYAMRVLDSLYFKKIAACPLSASLTYNQESRIREIIKMNDEEVFILFIGIGNYTTKCLTTKSTRKPVDISVI